MADEPSDRELSGRVAVVSGGARSAAPVQVHDGLRDLAPRGIPAHEVASGHVEAGLSMQVRMTGSAVLLDGGTSPRAGGS